MKFRKIEKVLLVNPANTMPHDSVRRLATPLGLMYIAAGLRDAGISVSILDSTLDGYYNTRSEGDMITYGLDDGEFIKKVIDAAPDMVGVTSMFSAHQSNVLRHCRLIKENLPNIPIVLGGIHPSLFPEECLESSDVDFVIIGEGEFRLARLVKALNGGAVDPGFDGVAWKDSSAVPRVREMTERIIDMDSISMPARDLIDMEKYISIGVPYAPFPRKERVEQIMTSRGCPFNCIFCSTVKFWGRKFRIRSVDNIMKEVEHLVSAYGIEELQFTDDNMTVNYDRTVELMKRLKEYKLSWCTPHGLMAITLDTKLIRLMSEAGAYQLTFAIESGSKRVLDEIIHKPVPEKHVIADIIKACKDNGIQTHGLFVVGFPGEKREEIMETLNYPAEVGFDGVSFFIANPIPGSELHKVCLEKGYIERGNRKMNFKLSEIRIPPDSPDYFMPNKELVALVDDSTRKYNQLFKERNPGAWNLKYSQFLKKHGDKADLLMGRVT